MATDRKLTAVAANGQATEEEAFLLQEAHHLLVEEEPTNPFDDLQAMAVEGVDMLQGETVLFTIAVRAPRADEFFRVHPDPAYSLPTITLEHEEGMTREEYLVLPKMRPAAEALGGKLRYVRIFTCVTRFGVPFLWPAPIPGANGNKNAWHETGMMVAEKAKKKWVRRISNKRAGTYEAFIAEKDMGDPQWPAMPFNKLLELGFGKDRTIGDTGHAIIRQLNGED